MIRLSWDQKGLFEFVSRGKKSLALNLKTPERATVLEKICFQSDKLIDPFSEGAWGKGNFCQISYRRIPDSPT